MGWEAQAGAGVGFLVVGLLQGFKQIRSFRKRSNTRNRLVFHQGRARKSWYHDLELYIILFLSLSHIVCDMVVSGTEGNLDHALAASVNLQRMGVACVFLFYAVVALIVDNTRVLPIPPEIIKLLILFAFGQEFLLFYLQRDHVGLESQYHYLSLVPVGVCLGSTAAEIAYPKAVLPPLVRSMGLILQGTWFLQIAVSLFSPKWVSKGCALHEIGEGDYTVTCQGMNLMRGQAIATLQFNCHLALLLVLLLPMYALMSKLYTGSPQHYDPLGDSEGHFEATELLQMQESSLTSPQHHMHADHFHVIQEDEELEEPTPRRGSTDSNGFRSMLI